MLLFVRCKPILKACKVTINRYMTWMRSKSSPKAIGSLKNHLAMVCFLGAKPLMIGGGGALEIPRKFTAPLTKNSLPEPLPPNH